MSNNFKKSSQEVSILVTFDELELILKCMQTFKNKCLKQVRQNANRTEDSNVFFRKQGEVQSRFATEVMNKIKNQVSLTQSYGDSDG